MTVRRAEAALGGPGSPSAARSDPGDRLPGSERLHQAHGGARRRAAAELAARLVEIVYELAHRHGGRPVKLLGDEVMFHLPDPAQGVLCGLELVEHVPQLGLPCARFGLDSGPVVFQNGGYWAGP